MKHRTLIAALALTCSLAFASSVSAKLPAPPAPSPEAKAKAADAAAKTAWGDKVAAYQLCQAQDRAADAYRAQASLAGKTASPKPTGMPACTDPGPYAAMAAPATEAKPIEASGAHSPTATAVAPPSSAKPAAEMAPAAPKQ